MPFVTLRYDLSVVAATVRPTYPDLLEYLHISDRYSGLKPDDTAAAGAEATPKTAPATADTTRVIQARFAVPRFGSTSPEEMAAMVPCVRLVIYLIDKLKRVKLSKEARARAEKNRARMEEQQSKFLHSQRQESAQARRDERVRQEKERIMNEADPRQAAQA